MTFALCARGTRRPFESEFFALFFFCHFGNDTPLIRPPLPRTRSSALVALLPRMSRAASRQEQQDQARDRRGTPAAWRASGQGEDFLTRQTQKLSPVLGGGE